MKKHVQENLFQFKEKKFFQLFEELKEEDNDTKQLVQEQDETGIAVVDKAKENFSRFEKDAKGLVIRYKEFWTENETTRANFGEGAKTYKMFDSNYVVGLLKLPDEALETSTIDSELSEVPNNKEEEKEVEDEVKDEVEDDEKESLKEGFESPQEEEEELPAETPDMPEEPEEIMPEDPGAQGPVAGGSDPLKPQPEFEEHPIDDEILDTPGEEKMCLVVYDMVDEQRTEVFRCSVNSVMHAFEEFYENGFKGAMKAIIAKAREKVEQVKKETEVKAKEEELQTKKAKVDQFLKT